MGRIISQARPAAQSTAGNLYLLEMARCGERCIYSNRNLPLRNLYPTVSYLFVYCKESRKILNKHLMLLMGHQETDTVMSQGVMERQWSLGKECSMQAPLLWHCRGGHTKEVQAQRHDYREEEAERRWGVLSGNQRSEFLEIPVRCYQLWKWQESTVGADFGLLDLSMTNIREAAQLLLWDWTWEAKSSLCHFLLVGGQTWRLRASVSSSANWFLYQVCCEDRRVTTMPSRGSWRTQESALTSFPLLPPVQSVSRFYCLSFQPYSESGSFSALMLSWPKTPFPLTWFATITF